MKSVIGISIIFVLLFIPTFMASAQDETPTPVPTAIPVSVEVNWGDFALDIDGNEPLAGCVVATRATLDGRYATVVIFVRQVDGVFTPLGTFESRATAALTTASPGVCLPLGVG